MLPMSLTDLPSATANNRLSRVWYLDKTDINNNGGTANSRSIFPTVD